MIVHSELAVSLSIHSLNGLGRPNTSKSAGPKVIEAGKVRCNHHLITINAYMIVSRACYTSLPSAYSENNLWKNRSSRFILWI